MSAAALWAAATVLVCTIFSGDAFGQNLVASLSEKDVAITSSFTGTTLTLSGNIEPGENAVSARLSPSYDIITVVRGPLADRVLRQKTRQLGVWLNSSQVQFDNFPAYFRVLSNRPIADIASTKTLDEQGITPTSQTRRAIDPWAENGEAFSTELLRLMHESQLYGEDEAGIEFLSRSFYTAHIELPADVPNGRFVAQTYLFRNGEILDRRSDAFLVRTEGFEQFLGNAAHRFPLLYGLASAALAIFTGWLGGVLFRR